MTDALRAFLEELIDYAGLFPPAELPMPDAVATYARHLRSDHAWMVGRFVCPVAGLESFREEGDGVFADLAPIHVAGIATRMPGKQSMLGAARSDGARAATFEKEGGGRVDVLEVRLPDDVVDGSEDDIVHMLDEYEAALERGGLQLSRVFYEIGRDEGWSDRVNRCVAALARSTRRGFKIRCGGVTPDAYPSPEEVATAIRASARAGVPFKATAGLHHPLRHARPDGDVVQHGFLNVFLAGILAQGGAAALEDLLDDRELSSFSFSDKSLGWEDRTAQLDEIRAARAAFATSFGSCDIDEPVEDLRSFGLL